ncbi:MAG: MFS transporter [Dyadobacter fermentans]
MTYVVNRHRLFLASCFAIITTAFSFSIRAGVLPQLAAEFGLTAGQLGFINSMFFFGFPISMVIGGIVYHSVGPKAIMQIAVLAHTAGILLTIYAGGYVGLLVSTFFIGFGNGCTEAACNPMIADMYDDSKLNKMLGRFHMWFPGGIVIGSLISKFMTSAGLSWQAQIWTLMIPTVIYAILFFAQVFPKPKVEGVTSISKNFEAMRTPLFLFTFCCMAMTAITEFGPNQWVTVVLSASGADAMLVLALTFGVMTVGRIFTGPVVARLGQTGVLLGGAVLAAVGIYMFSTLTGPIAYLAAVIFGLGVCFNWPVMIGFVAQRVPLSGALGMSVIGGVGMLSTSIFQPFIGAWIDDAYAENAAKGLTGTVLELASGQDTLSIMLTFPLILIGAFVALWLWVGNSKPQTASEHLLDRSGLEV